MVDVGKNIIIYQLDGVVRSKDCAELSGGSGKAAVCDRTNEAVVGQQQSCCFSMNRSAILKRVRS